jgi:DNA primase
MGKYYPPEIIDKMMSEIPYQEVLRYYNYPVRGTGKNRGSNCPNCGKDHEHFKINTHKNVANCFVCHWAGNPIQFIQKVENVTFIEAVERYAEIGHFSLPNYSSNKFTRKERILYHAAKYYSQFHNDYLLKRGISQQVIEKKLIGYAEGGKKLKEYLNSLSFSDEELLEVGLIKERNGVLMDFFFQCVVIPIFLNGRVVDLYGRYTKEGQTKHLYLYGDYIAYNLDNIDPRLPVIIVESIINALTLESDNINNVMAIGGATKFTLKHAKQLKAKGVKIAYIGYDTGDLSKGGQKGAIQTGKLLKEVDIKSLVLNMPSNTDINELYLRFPEPRKKLKEIIQKAEPIELYEARLILDGIDVEWIQNYLKERIGVVKNA